MDKSRVAAVLASYCPPLSPSQIDAIAEELSRSELEKAEVGTVEAAKTAEAAASSQKRKRKS